MKTKPHPHGWTMSLATSSNGKRVLTLSFDPAPQVRRPGSKASAARRRVPVLKLRVRFAAAELSGFAPLIRIRRRKPANIIALPNAQSSTPTSL